MNDPLAKTPDSGATKGSGPAPAVAPAPAAKAGGIVAAPVHARESVAQFGGNSTGRAPDPKFKFPVHTPEGQAERREADADRKKLRRQNSTRLAEPPPLPSAGAPLPGEPAPAPGVEVPGVVGAPGESSPVVPWTPDLLKEFTDEIVNACEASRQNGLSTLAKEGGLPEKIVKKIHDDSKYPGASKRTLQLAAPKVGAKLLNQTGVSAEHADLIAFFGAAVMIWQDGRSLKADVLEMIEAHNAAKHAPPPAVAARL